KIFVGDRGNFRVQVYDRNEAPLRMVGSGGGREGQFGPLGAGGVVVDSADLLYASDTSNDRILVFDFRGKYFRAFGGSGSEPGKLRQPNGLAVDRLGRILVADTRNKRVAIFNADGTFVENKGVGELAEPTHVATDASGALYVT